MKNVKDFQIAKISTSMCCLVFASFLANFSLALLIKVLLIECSSLEIVCHLTSNAIRNFHFSLVDHSTAYITKMHFVTLDQIHVVILTTERTNAGFAEVRNTQNAWISYYRYLLVTHGKRVKTIMGRKVTLRFGI